MATTERYTITAALIYANGPIHIGHLAGCYLPADIYVRYLRQKNKDVAFISGTDEHGVPITLKAAKEGVTPQQVVDKYYHMIRDSFESFGISFDEFSRTTTELHHKQASEFFLKLYEKGVFTEQVTEQYFDPKVERFLADRYIVGTCPRCENPDAYGDQCEKCGSTLSPTDLINPRSVLSGEKPIKKETKNWFLPLDKMQPEIEEFIKSRKNWKSNVYGQCMSWLNQGLQPRAMTRDLDWGVKVPLPDAEGKVLYVWFDAPIGYISNTIEWAEKNGKNWEDYWKKEDTKLIHFIGKDNIVFHCIIFPAMLMAHGDFILPDNVPANEFLNLEGQKISTSRNWAVWLHEYLEYFPGKQDILRYSLCSNAPETKDNDFTWKEFQARNNNELVAILGNFVNRAVVLTHKYFDGKVPPRGPVGDAEKDVLEALSSAPEKIGKAIENYHFREALSDFMNLARAGNKYLADTEPWKLIKEDKEKTGTILNIALQLAASLAGLMEPFMPFTSVKLNRQLGLDKSQSWDKLGQPDLMETGMEISKAELLFEKLEDDVIQKQIDKLEKSSMENKSAEAQKQTDQETDAIKPEITFEDFTKLDLRVGKILNAEKIKGADKLLKLEVDLGFEKRTIVSGIALHFSPEEIMGRMVTVLINLAPRKMRGVESQGMILMAEDKGKLLFVEPSGDAEPGSSIS